MSREEIFAEIAWIDQILDALSEEGANDTTFSYPERDWDDDGPHAA